MNKNIKKKFGRNLRKFRKQKGFTQEELALNLDLDNSYIGKVENAQLNITLEKIIAIADFLGIEVVDLFK
ncbi:MAG: helix-turn-helix transcriptional regulator [bacterium]|nr:helix-turn-helix transcriptional regulator [bacterium]